MSVRVRGNVDGVDDDVNKERANALCNARMRSTTRLSLVW